MDQLILLRVAWRYCDDDRATLEKSDNVRFIIHGQLAHHRPQISRQLPPQPNPQPRPPGPGEEPEGAREPAPHAVTAATVERSTFLWYLHAHIHHVLAAHAIATPSADHLGSRGDKG